MPVSLAAGRRESGGATDVIGRIRSQHTQLRRRGRQAQRTESALQGSHGDRPEAVSLLDRLALLSQAQHAVHSSGRSGFDDSVDTSATASNAPATSVEDNMSFTGRGQHLGQRPLRLVNGEP